MPSIDEPAAGARSPWSKLSPATLRIVHRIAKDPRKGLRPFFADPKEMIILRNLVSATDER